MGVVPEDVVCELFDSGCVSSFPRWHRNAQYALCKGPHSLHLLLILRCQMSSPDSHTEHRDTVNYAGVKRFLETRVHFDFSELAQVIHALQRLIVGLTYGCSGRSTSGHVRWLSPGVGVR